MTAATNKSKPRKFIKTLHRKAIKEGARVPLRTFARVIAECKAPAADVAKAREWCTRKGIAFGGAA